MRFATTAALFTASSASQANLASAKDLASAQSFGLRASTANGAIDTPAMSAPAHDLDERRVQEGAETSDEEQLSDEDRENYINIFSTILDALDYLGVFG